jgi:hypothetical protein
MISSVIPHPIYMPTPDIIGTSRRNDANLPGPIGVNPGWLQLDTTNQPMKDEPGYFALDVESVSLLAHDPVHRI